MIFYPMRLFDTLPIRRGRMTVGECREGLVRGRRAHSVWCSSHPDSPEYAHHRAMIAKYDAALEIMSHWPSGTRVFSATEELMECDRRATDALLGVREREPEPPAARPPAGALLLARLLRAYVNTPAARKAAR